MPSRVLITMDDLEVAVPTNAAFEHAGFDTTMVSPMDDERSVLRRAAPDLAILTGGLHETATAGIISIAREGGIPTLGLLEPTDPDPARFAGTLGLTAYLSKPVDPAEVLAEAGRLMARRELQNRTGIIGESSAIQEVLVKIEQVAPVSSTVLIEGESGTGKELVAKAIHDLGPRREKSFVAVNCAALPETLLESELFGHEKGSFTGAAERRLGRFELASGGTLFLDEVGEMPRSVQVKLLRVLESRSFFRVGGVQSIRVDVRVVAATNQSLKDLVAKDRLRDDLFYRLNVLYCYLPPLRERKGDIPLLVRRFTREFSKHHNKTFRGISPEAMQILVNAHWPGNVRQLRNLVESMVVLAPGERIRASDIPSDVKDQGTRLLPVHLPQAGGSQHVPQAQELEFIFRSLVELKLQVEEIKRRIDQHPEDRSRLAEPEGALPAYELNPDVTVGFTDEFEELPAKPEAVVYRSGMTMAEVERAAIEAALQETGGNRRNAAKKLGIGERTLYRKIKEFGLS